MRLPGEPSTDAGRDLADDCRSASGVAFFRAADSSARAARWLPVSVDADGLRHSYDVKMKTAIDTRQPLPNSAAVFQTPLVRETTSGRSAARHRTAWTD